jgi:hypothetical protein
MAAIREPSSLAVLLREVCSHVRRAMGGGPLAVAPVKKKYLPPDQGYGYEITISVAAAM